jgi:hypothetical protein
MKLKHIKQILSENVDQSLIDAVKQYAKAHYEEGGWDYVVETMDDEDIAEDIAGATTPKEAIAKMKKIADLLGGHREEIQSTAF